MAEIVDKWFPRGLDKDAVQAKLSSFYSGNNAYHQMTRTEDKASHPQAQLLSCLVEAGNTYVEVGCGSGAVCRELSKTARVIGIDVSRIPLVYARSIKDGVDNPLYVQGLAECLPCADNAVAGTYSFELLEHVWDPISVIKEMVRITKPGGFVLFSTPNRLSLDLHVHKRRLARVADFIMATVRYCLDKISRRTYLNFAPDLDGDLYPDCDAVSTLIASNLQSAVEAMGCKVCFLDTTCMRSWCVNGATGLGFQKMTAKPLWRFYGDHILLLALKTQ